MKIISGNMCGLGKPFVSFPSVFMKRIYINVQNIVRASAGDASIDESRNFVMYKTTKFLPDRSGKQTLLKRLFLAYDCDGAEVTVELVN